MDFSDPMNILFVLYIALVIAKTFLCWAMLPYIYAAYAKKRYMGLTELHPVIPTILTAILVPMYLAVALLVVLFQEKLSFFVLYSKGEVYDGVISA